MELELADVFKALNKALHDKDSEISLLQWQAETAEKKVVDLEVKCAKLQAQLEEATAVEPKEDGWKPERGGNFWYFDCYGIPVESNHDRYTFAYNAIACGNCAPTEEELRAKEPEILAALGLEKWEG